MTAVLVLVLYVHVLNLIKIGHTISASFFWGANVNTPTEPLKNNEFLIANAHGGRG